MQAHSSSKASTISRPPVSSLGQLQLAEELEGRAVLPARWATDDAPSLAKDDPSRILQQAEIQAELGPLLPAVAGLHLLVVEREQSVRETCCAVAGRMGFTVIAAGDLAEAREMLERRRVDLVLLDLASAGGVEVLTELKALAPETSVLVMTACATVSSAVEALRAGAGDYLTKPLALPELARTLRRASERQGPLAASRRLREKLRNQKSAGHLAGSSAEMEKLYRMISKVTHTTYPVLILGETGTGKELVARAIHFHGPGATKPFVPVDCGSLTPSLMEGELFGYVKGAFPGAVRGKEGLLTSGEGGTVFLDDVTELPVDLQSKLLRALQEKVVRPLGSTQMVAVTARILAGTDRNLLQMVEQGRFRRDLYFRLNVVSLRIPPLRERKGDVAELAQYFLDRQQRESGLSHHFSADSLRLMVDYDWPGNVRELEAAVERACSLSSGPVLHMVDLPTQLQDLRRHAEANRDAERAAALQAAAAVQSRPEMLLVRGEEIAVGDRIVPLAELERQTICSTIRHLKGDKLLAAKLLGIGKTTLYRKLKEYEISD